MKLLLDRNIHTISNITTNSAEAGYSIGNVREWDSYLIWKAASFTLGVVIDIDLGSAKAFDSIALNNANFASATIQANDSDSWGDPAYSQVVTLGQFSGIRKGFFHLSTLTYRYIRISIPVQSLDSGTVPFLGNLFIGNATEFIASKFDIQKNRAVDVFTPDNGIPRKTFNATFYELAVSITKRTLAETDVFSVEWDRAVLFDCLNNDVSRMWPVYAPEKENQAIRNPNDTDRQFLFQMHP